MQEVHDKGFIGGKFNVLRVKNDVLFRFGLVWGLKPVPERVYLAHKQ